MIQVKDGSRTLQFDGQLIGESSSRHRDSSRWVEFSLYRTEESGIYVLSRVGISLIYHYPECEVVERNKLRDAPASELRPDAVPCRLCRPDMVNFPIVAPEKPRYWAQVCNTADAVVKALMKEDDNGSLYLTFVAQRLLEDASQHDEAIKEAYLVETIR